MHNQGIEGYTNANGTAATDTARDINGGDTIGGAHQDILFVITAVIKPLVDPA